MQTLRDGKAVLGRPWGEAGEKSHALNVRFEAFMEVVSCKNPFACDPQTRSPVLIRRRDRSFRRTF